MDRPHGIKIQVPTATWTKAASKKLFRAQKNLVNSIFIKRKNYSPKKSKINFVRQKINSKLCLDTGLIFIWYENFMSVIFVEIKLRFFSVPWAYLDITICKCRGSNTSFLLIHWISSDKVTFIRKINWVFEKTVRNQIEYLQNHAYLGQIQSSVWRNKKLT